MDAPNENSIIHKVSIGLPWRFGIVLASGRSDSNAQSRRVITERSFNTQRRSGEVARGLHIAHNLSFNDGANGDR